MVDLVDEGYDLAVRIARLPNSIAGQPAAHVDAHGAVRVAGVPATPRRARAPVGHRPPRVLTYSLLSTGDQWEFQGRRASVGVKVPPRMRTNSGDTCRVPRCATRGSCCSQLSWSAGPAGRRAGRGDAGLPLDRAGCLRGVPVSQARDAQGPALIDFLVKAFRMRAWPP